MYALKIALYGNIEPTGRKIKSLVLPTDAIRAFFIKRNP
jgi:hypothetical protein